MSYPSPRKSKYQFQLRTLMVFTGLVCVSIIGWLWWEETRELRELTRDIRTSGAFTEVEKKLFVSLLRQDKASRLVDELGIKKHSNVPGLRLNSIHDLSWHGTFVNSRNQQRQVFVFSTLPPKSRVSRIVVTNRQFSLVATTTAPKSGGFYSASLCQTGGLNRLSIDTRPWSYSKGKKRLILDFNFQEDSIIADKAKVPGTKK